MLGIQVVGILFGLFMIYYSFLNYKKKQFGKAEFGLWLVLWIFFIYVALWPHSIDFVVENIASMQRPLDFFIVMGFIFLIALSFYNYSNNKKNSKMIEKIVAETAMEKASAVKKENER